MSEFEYLAVFVSIVFGISVTHVLGGAIHAITIRTTDYTRLILTAFFFVVMILNWWTGYTWSYREIWSFDLFLVIVLWSVSHYIAVITLYLPRTIARVSQIEHKKTWFLWAFIGVLATDILKAAMAGELYQPWYYLPFVLHYVVLALIAIWVNKPAIHFWTACYFLVSILVWAMVVRRYLPEL